MSQFRYIVYEGGKRVTRHMEALSITEAKAKLREKNVVCLKIESVAPKLFFSKLHISATMIARFTEQIGQLLQANLPLYESLTALGQEYSNHNLGKLIHDLCERIKKGETLSQGLKQYPHLFSSFYIALVEAGETTGSLASSLIKLGLLLSKQGEVRKKITSCLLYPCMLGVVMIAVVAVLLLYVVPSLEELLDPEKQSWITKIVFNASYFVRHGGIYCITSIAVAVGSAFYFMKKKSQRLPLIVYRLPLFKTFFLKKAMMHFAYTLGLLTEGGVPMHEALQLALATMQHPKLEAVWSQIRTHVLEGKRLHEQLKENKEIPSFVAKMIYIGENTGDMSGALKKIATIYEAEVEQSLHKILSMLQPVMLLLMGVIVGVIMSAVMLPLTDISRMIGI